MTSLWALWLVAPTKSMLIQLIARSSSPEVSLAFLKQLYSRDPQNRDVVKQIVHSYTQLGELDEASALVRSILVGNNGQRDWQALKVYLSLLLERSYQSDPDVKQAAVTQLLQLIDDIDTIPEADIARLYADTAIAYSRPDKGLDYLKPHIHSGETSYPELIKLALESENYSTAVTLQTDAFMENQTMVNANALFSLFATTFQPKKSQAFLENYRGRLYQQPAFLAAAITHSQQLGNLDTALALSQQLLSIDPTAGRYASSAQLAIRVADLPLATQLQQAAVKQDPSMHNIEVLHQLYRWQGKIAAAQGLSIQLLNRNSGTITTKQLRDGVEESRALGDIYYEGLFYNAIAKRAAVTPSEYDAWLNAVEKSQGTDVALSSLTALAAKRPYDSALISHKARLYSYKSDHDAVINEWRKLIRLRNPTLAEAQRAANAFIWRNQPEQALQALVTPKTWFNADSDYIEAVSSLAWDTSNRQISTRSQDTLVARASGNLDIYRYINLMTPITDERQAKLLALYQRTDNATLLLAVIRARAATQDYNQLVPLLTLANNDPSLTNNIEILSYKAQLALHQQQTEQAKTLFARILTIDSTHTSAISNLLWLAIAENDTATLRTLYDRYHTALAGNAELWLAFASAAQQLGETREATAWYKALLKNSDEADTSVILNYASLLEQQGQAEKAYQLRRYLLTQQRDALLALSDNAATYRYLVGLFTDARFARTLIENKVLAAHSNTTSGEKGQTAALSTADATALTSELFSQYLAENRADSVLFWQHRSALGSYTLPDWQQLSLALQQKDKHKVEHLLAKALKLPEADENVALQFVGRHQEAWQHGQSQIGNMADKQAEMQLKRAHVLQHPHKTHSVRSQVMQISQWDITRFSLDYYRPHVDGNWRLGTDWQQSGTPDPFEGNAIDDEFRLRGKYFHQYSDSDFTVGLDLADGLGDQRLGVSFDYQVTLDDYWQLAVNAGLNQHIEASDLLTIAGQDNRLGISATYLPTARESVFMQFNLHDLSTRFDDDIGQGWDFSLRVAEQFFFNDPAWQIYADFTAQQINLNNDPLTGINQWHKGTRPIVSSDFIDDDYQRLSIGQRVWHGEPGLPGATVPSPRYWLDTSLGYNTLNADMDFTVSAGLGWRVFGNDELYFTTDWQSQDRNGDESLRLRLGYYYSF
ncbi:tetratricopeptide repeat protein [Photobacterium aphoticum]|uniref:tetratricopeptide repeat protein n=1 Tax=Photobacterium aphoticum TaxID=754436 RepID=UPI001304FCDA|nr:tetratricopeptide repeat protein [Photobacterium aphoticum]